MESSLDLCQYVQHQPPAVGSFFRSWYYFLFFYCIFLLLYHSIQALSHRPIVLGIIYVCSVYTWRGPGTRRVILCSFFENIGNQCTYIAFDKLWITLGHGSMDNCLSLGLVGSELNPLSVVTITTALSMSLSLSIQRCLCSVESLNLWGLQSPFLYLSLPCTLYLFVLVKPSHSSSSIYFGLPCISPFTVIAPFMLIFLRNLVTFFLPAYIKPFSYKSCKVWILAWIKM